MATVSVIIPTWGDKRSRNVENLLVDLHKQTLKPTSVELVRNVAPNGRARNVGAARTSSEVLVFLDDDVRLGHECVLESLVRALERPDFGLVGTSQLLPPDSSDFQRSLARQLTRSQSQVVNAFLDSDMVTTQCCAIRRDVFERLGGFHEGLLRGVDPEFRHRVRGSGLRIVVVPDVWHFHPVPGSLQQLARLAFRDGYSSAQVAQRYPEAVLYNPEGHVGEFEARQGPLVRYARRLLGVVRQVVAGQWLGALYGSVYVAGYLWAVLRTPTMPRVNQTKG